MFHLLYIPNKAECFSFKSKGVMSSKVFKREMAHSFAVIFPAV